MYKMCSPVFADFLKNIMPENDFDMDEFILSIENHMDDIAKELSIGRMVLKVIEPVTVFDNNVEEKQVEIYNSYALGQDVYTREFVVGETGLAIFTVNSRMNKDWEEEDKENIKLFVHILHSYLEYINLKNEIFSIKTKDGMTGTLLGNEFYRRGSILCLKGEHVSYVAAFINIKNMKYINQTVGSSHGDEVLIRFCKIVHNFIKGDELFARLGGDNFSVFIDKKRVDRFLALFDNMKIKIDVGEGEHEFTIKARIGLKDIKSSDNMTDIMNGISATQRYIRTHNTQDIIWFEESMIRDELFGRKFAASFAKMLEMDKVEVLYQPIICLTDNSLEGVEALPRVEFGGEIFYPEQFIPILEENEIVIDLDFHVLRKVCRNIKSWLERGLEVKTVAVNFSRKHLTDAQFADKIIDVIEREEVDPSYIEIELPEAIYGNDYPIMHDIFSELKEYGFKIAVDCFGIGHSTLSFVRNSVSEVVKIDRSFAKNLDDSSTQIVVESLINMLQKLNKKVVVEGVETDREIMFFRGIGCDMIQGFIFDEALTEEETVKRLLDKDWYRKLKP